MAYWLIKSEPSTWSWDDQVNAGAKGAAWEGVRNHQAKQNLMKMKKGERAFFFHTGEEKRIMGVVEVIAEFRPDPSEQTGKFGLVDVKAAEALPRPVTLVQCRGQPRLKHMVLVNNTRLSVQPVTAEEWRVIATLAGLKG